MEIKTVSCESSAKFIERKSSFFGYVFPISSEEEVKPIIEHLRKSHKKANHVAFAYRLARINKINELVFDERASDDGEPSRTAGAPLLRLLQRQELGDVLICIARIFGGIKLGPSGLIKAYREAGKMALKENKIITKNI